MNQHTPHIQEVRPALRNQEADLSVDVSRLLNIVKRQSGVIAASIALCLLIGFSYIMVAVPKYTSSASLLFEDYNGMLTGEDKPNTAEGAQEAYILSQVELLRSERVALAVVDKLRLDQDEQFTS